MRIGSSYRDIVRLVWPLALGMVNNAVMQFVDRAYLARESLEALEAVMPAGILAWVFMGFFQSLVGYANVLIGQYHGAGDAAKCRATYRVATLVALAAGMLSVPLLFVGDAVLRLTANSPQLYVGESIYFTITILGAVSVYSQMAAAAYFTGMGRTRLVFGVNLLGNVLNIVLDPVFIFGWCGMPRLGIAGAAFVTVGSMFVQWGVLAFAARRTGDRAATDMRELRDILLRLLRFGLPSAMYEVLNMLSFSIFVFVTEGVGELELAVSNTCFTINYLLFAPMMGFSLGAQTLVAQAIGRGDPDAAAADARRTLILGVGFVAVFSALAIVFAHPILDLFASKAGADTATFHALGFTLLLLMAAWQVFDSADVIICGALKGGGDTRFVMGWMLFAAFIVWMPLVFAVRHFHNTMPALWGTMILFVLVGGIGSTIRWCGGRWRSIRVV